MSRYRVESGRYRQPAELQKRQMGKNSYGETTEDWLTVANIRCSVQPINGREFFDKEAVNSKITHRIRLRHSKSLQITPDMRLIYMSRVFTITSVIDYQEQHNEIQLMCEELVQ
jgi:SPP1 family predicted phage head-tail adaptor